MITLHEAERISRNEGSNEYWYIDPNQFALMEETEANDMAARDPEVDERIDTENEACEIALRLANFLEAPVTVSKFVQSGAFPDNFVEAEDESIVVRPQLKQVAGV